MPKSTKTSIPKAFSNVKRTRVYMDYASSVEANPGSIHRLGLEAKQKLAYSRRKVAEVLSAREEEIIFTSGGTESNNLAIWGTVLSTWELSSQVGAKLPKLPHLVTTNIEHPSVLETFKMLEGRGLVQVSIVPVEKSGLVDPKKIKKAINKNTVLVSVMYANNEIGTIQPIREIAKEIRHWKKSKSYKPKAISYPLFHTDAVQAANYLDLNVEKLGVDLLSLSGSKIEGGGRVGVLYKRKSAPLESIFVGGDQEMRLRPGTENLPAIIKFASALEEAQKIKDKEGKRLTKLRDYFFLRLSRIRIPEVKGFEIRLNGDSQKRLPNNLNVAVGKIPSDLLVIELSARGIFVSSKSACKSSGSEGSYVIQAIAQDKNPEIGGVRFSFGRATTKKDINFAVSAVSTIVLKLSKWY